MVEKMSFSITPSLRQAWMNAVMFSILLNGIVEVLICGQTPGRSLLARRQSTWPSSSQSPKAFPARRSPVTCSTQEATSFSKSLPGPADALACGTSGAAVEPVGARPLALAGAVCTVSHFLHGVVGGGAALAGVEDLPPLEPAAHGVGDLSALEPAALRISLCLQSWQRSPKPKKWHRHTAQTCGVPTFPSRHAAQVSPYPL
mmetsp:Transcript_66594/g.186098  ORF Transcript_66594/g.186098 Transcript_66594/m.186098 type:complete len:202 (-) Transcript_66594:168-773(-)